MKLWDKGYATDKMVEQFTVGNDRILDLKLAPYDVQASLAHAKMLKKTGLLTETDYLNIEKGLLEIQKSIEQGTFTIEEEFEDVHSKIEYVLTRTIGEAGKKIHTARSRNDQVLVALHLYFKQEIKNIKGLVRKLFETLISLSEKHKDDLMPGYTHTQIAMPSSFGLWFGAFAEILADDITLLNTAYVVADQNPLGSAAGYGSSFPIDRNHTTQLLGFQTMKYNSIAAQLSRGRTEKTLAFALASVSATLSKMAADLILFMCGNFGFVKFPEEFTTGSSIMPHKKNPDVLELLRAKSNRIQNLPNEITLLINNLTTGYHRDFQLLKQPVMEAVDAVKENLKVFDLILQNIEVEHNILKEETLYRHLYTVESVNKLVQQGIPFREAYQEIGKMVMDNTYQPDTVVKHTHQGSMGNLCNEKIREKFMNNFHAV